MRSRRRVAVRMAPAVAVTLMMVGGTLSACTSARASALTDPPPAATAVPSAPSVLGPTASAGASSSAPPVPSKKPTATPRPRPTPSKPRSTSKPAPPTTLASKLHTLPSTTTQVVIVHAASASTTHATLETFSKVHGVWVKQFSPMAARIGQNGFSDHHVEGTPSTPTGVYGFGSTMYGNGSDPGLHYAYHHLVTDDWWDENPSSPRYNQFAHGSDPGGGSEALWTIMPQYEFLAFITYNSPPTGTARGSAVFLHETDGQATLGCISLARSDLLDVLRWLSSSAHPRIVIGADSELSNF